MALFFSGEVYVFFRFSPTSTCQKCPPSILSQCLLQAGKHLLPKTPLKGSAEKVLPWTASPCVESAVEQAEAAEHWTDSRFRSRADLDELHAHPVRRVWGHQPVLLLTRSCVFSWFSFSLFPHSSFFCCNLSCQHCCALTVWRASAKLPKREAITWMPKLYFLAANPCNSQPIWKHLNFSVDLERPIVNMLLYPVKRRLSLNIKWNGWIINPECISIWASLQTRSAACLAVSRRWKGSGATGAMGFLKVRCQSCVWTTLK